MNKNTVLSLICLLLTAIQSYSQNHVSFSAEFSSGIGVGYWYIDHGPLRKGYHEDVLRIWEKSGPCVNLPIGISGAIAINRLQLGINIKNSRIYCDEVYYIARSDVSRSGHIISNTGSVDLLQFCLLTGIKMIDKSNYILSSRFSCGTFLENSLLDEEYNNTNKIVFNLEVSNYIRLGNDFIKVGISYSKSKMNFIDNSSKSAFNRINQFDLQLGLMFTFPEQN